MAKTATLVDAFNGTSLNTGLWTQFTGGSATFTYATSGAQVNFPASSTSSTDGDLTSVTTYDLTASYIYLHVITVPSSSTSADAVLRISQNSTNWYRFVKEGATLFCQRQIAGSTTTVASFSYSSSTHAYWRIIESGGVISWDTSADGITWTNRATFTNTLTLTAMTVLIAGTCFQNETSPGTYKWNNFNTLTLTESTTDSTAVSDTPTIAQADTISVTDSTATSDTPTIVVVSSGLNASVSDSSAVSDTPTIEVIDLIQLPSLTPFGGQVVGLKIIGP